jgi:hypothetical protein
VNKNPKMTTHEDVYLLVVNKNGPDFDYCGITSSRADISKAHHSPKKKKTFTKKSFTISNFFIYLSIFSSSP